MARQTLDSIVVENEPPCLARNDGFITNIWMRSIFYIISMDPLHRNQTYKEKCDENFGVKVYRL